MPSRANLLVTCQAMALLSLVAVVLSHLALTDIAHGEPDLTAEWTVLRLSAAVVIALCASVFALVWQARSGERPPFPRP